MAFAKAIETFMTLEDRGQSLGQKARAYVEQEHSMIGAVKTLKEALCPLI